MYRRWYVQLHKFLLSIPVPSTLYFDVLYNDILDDVSQISKPMKNFMYANQAHRFQSQIEASYFVESLPVAASIKQLLLYVLINFKSQFQELKHKSTSKTTKKGIKRKKDACKKTNRPGTGSGIVGKHKSFRAVLFSLWFDKYMILGQHD